LDLFSLWKIAIKQLGRVELAKGKKRPGMLDRVRVTSITRCFEDNVLGKVALLSVGRIVNLLTFEELDWALGCFWT
jgi:hypothetical protein